MDAICATATAKTTVDCYDFWDRAFRRAGMLDYTEGFYDGVPSVPYEQAQQRQIDFLLDQVGCQAGSRILDIGCGNGALLDEVRRRGAAGVGVTISPHQVEYCARRELDVRLLNYRDMGDDLSGRFDAVVANGSMEHFVQPADAAEGRAEAIYREFFEICHRAIDPRSTCRKLINTTIHFGRVRVDPRQAVRSPWSFRWNSDEFHYAFLVREFGGYYPSLGQFERCAEPRFKLAWERDATQDYHLTSEAWLRHGKRSMLSPKQWARMLPFLARRPRHAVEMLFSMLVTQSWSWQFRGEIPPMKHLWQLWEYQE